MRRMSIDLERYHGLSFGLFDADGIRLRYEMFL